MAYTPIDPTHGESISSLLDDDLRAVEAEQVVIAIQGNPKLKRQFETYSLIGDCLRGHGSAHAEQGFVQRVSRAIENEPIHFPNRPRRLGSESLRNALGGVGRKWAWPAMAASVAAVGFVTLGLWSMVSPGGSSSGELASASNMRPASAPISAAYAPAMPAGVVVLRASLEDAHTRQLLETHGSLPMRLRLSEERSRP